MGSASIETVFSEREFDLVVRSRSEAADGVVALTLMQADGSDLPAWTPGAHIDLLLADGVTRQYSLCGTPAQQDRWRIGVLLDEGGRGGSRLVHATLMEGTKVRVRGPRNHFPLLPAPKYVFIAGGIGITPVLSMMATAHEAGSEFQLFYGGRTRASMAFVDELSRYGDSVTLWPQDEAGLLDLAGILADPGAGTLVYSCGPEPLLNAVEERCKVWPDGSLHIERFAAKVPEAGAASEAFDVVLARSGVTVNVPAGMSIVEAVDKAGISVLTSCLEGVCGTCETAVREGVPDHRDSLLSQSEREAGDFMMICVSRSLTPQLVLDL